MTPSPLIHKDAYRALTLIFLFAVTLTMSAQWTAQGEEGGIPAYNAGPPPKGTKLPAILAKSELWGADAQYPYQTHAYDLASKIPTVLHQQPCYCYCDRMGRPHGPQQPAQLLRNHARRALLHLPEGTLLLLSAASEEEDRGPDSCGHHQRGLETDRPAIGSDHQLGPSNYRLSTPDSGAHGDRTLQSSVLSSIRLRIPE